MYIEQLLLLIVLGIVITVCTSAIGWSECVTGLKIIGVFFGVFTIAGMVWMFIFSLQPWRVTEINKYVPVVVGDTKVFLDKEGDPYNMYQKLGRDCKIVIERRYSSGPYANLFVRYPPVEYIGE